MLPSNGVTWLVYQSSGKEEAGSSVFCTAGIPDSCDYC